MSDYQAQFKLRIKRATAKVEHLQERLDKVNACCDDDDLKAVDTETAELISMLSDDIRNECHQAKMSLEWHRRA